MGYEQPPPGTAGLSALVGALVLVEVLRYDGSMPSSFGANREGITANVTIIEMPGDPSRRGEILAEIPILNIGMVRSLKQAVGTTVLGRLTAKQTRAGQNPAILLADYTPHDAQIADAFLAQRAPSGIVPPSAPAGPQYPTNPAASPASSTPPLPPPFNTPNPNEPPF